MQSPRSTPHQLSHTAVSALRFAFLVTLLILLWPDSAHAYAWMIRHDYTHCGQCHVEHSGGGPLTEYGRGMGEMLLRTHYGNQSGELLEPGNVAGFLWGAIDIPPPLSLGGDIRVLSMHRKIDGVKLYNDLIWMQADLEATLELDRFVASGSIGYADEGAFGATVTRDPASNLVSRQHWIGYSLGETNQAMLRAGRMNLPFGIRSIEHTLWARNLTRTDINDDQQYGVAFAYSSDRIRSEIMAIAGNFQLRPDTYRERGYSGTLEWTPLNELGLGVSSLVTHAELDTLLLRPVWRHAHGIFGRWLTGFKPLVLLTEWDYVVQSPKYLPRREGIVGYLQADIEAEQGVHFIVTGETRTVGLNSPPASWGLWLSYAWFFAPHTDLRLDGIFQSLGNDNGRTDATYLLLQAHVYL